MDGWIGGATPKVQSAHPLLARPARGCPSCIRKEDHQGLSSMRTRLLLPVSVRLRVVEDSALQPREGREGGRSPARMKSMPSCGEVCPLRDCRFRNRPTFTTETGAQASRYTLYNRVAIPVRPVSDAAARGQSQLSCAKCCRRHMFHLKEAMAWESSKDMAFCQAFIHVRGITSLCHEVILVQRHHASRPSARGGKKNNNSETLLLRRASSAATAAQIPNSTNAIVARVYRPSDVPPKISSLPSRTCQVVRMVLNRSQVDRPNQCCRKGKSG